MGTHYRVSTVSIPGLKLNKVVQLNEQHYTKVLLINSYQSGLPLQCRPHDAVLLELLCIENKQYSIKVLLNSFCLYDHILGAILAT